MPLLEVLGRIAWNWWTVWIKLLVYFTQIFIIFQFPHCYTTRTSPLCYYWYFLFNTGHCDKMSYWHTTVINRREWVNENLSKTVYHNSLTWPSSNNKNLLLHSQQFLLFPIIKISIQQETFNKVWDNKRV